MRPLPVVTDPARPGADGATEPSVTATTNGAGLGAGRRCPRGTAPLTLNRMLPRRLPAVAGALTAGVLLLPVPVASAQPAPVTAGTAAEAWYRTLPVQAPAEADPCTLPVGCLPAAPAPLPSQYAAGTLHVGVAGGAEESRTYLALDLSGVEPGAEVTGGTLTLPVATDPSAGTTAPDQAALRACAVTAPVEDGVDGSLTGAPPVDCATSSDAAFVPAEAGAPAAFTVDLAPFAEVLSAGGSSLALVPAEEPGEAWHVAFSRRDRQAEGATPISASLQVAQEQTVEPAPADTGEATFDDAPLTLDTPGLDAGASFAAPPLAAGEQPLSAPVTPEVAAPTAQVPVAAVLAGPFAYPAVFLLPLLVAGATGWTGRALTRDLAGTRP